MSSGVVLLQLSGGSVEDNLVEFWDVMHDMHRCMQAKDGYELSQDNKMRHKGCLPDWCLLQRTFREK
jgi:hypothetical protein